MRIIPKSTGGKAVAAALGAYMGLMSTVGFVEAKDLLQRKVAYDVHDSNGLRELRGTDAVTYCLKPKGSPADIAAESLFFYYPAKPGIELAYALYGKQ